MGKKYKNKHDFEKNIGRKAKAIDGAIIGTTGRVGIIKDVFGDDLAGYRYELEFIEPITFKWKQDLERIYPSVFLVKIIAP